MSIHSDLNIGNAALIKNFARLDHQNQYEIFRSLRDLSDDLSEILERTRENKVSSAICDTVLNKYDIGCVVQLSQIFGGYANETYGIYTQINGERQTWIFRIYLGEKDIKEVMFEHGLLHHAKKNGFRWGAVPIVGRNGETWQQIEYSWKEKTISSYCAVYEYLEGNEPYDWINNWAPPGVPEITYVTGAELLAEFHNSVRDFSAEGLNRQELPINDLVKVFPDMLAGYQRTCEQQGRENLYTRYVDSKMSYVRDVCKRAAIPAGDCGRLPVNALQCDYHPGNLKYDSMGRTCGIYDFDWGKTDIRLFEVGLAVVYSFVSWETESDGVLNLEATKKFIEAYNRKLAEIGELTPMTALEKNYLYESLLMGNIYLFLWCTRFYTLNPDVNDYEYLYYLQHQMRSCKWVEEHESLIREFSKNI